MTAHGRSCPDELARARRFDDSGTFGCREEDQSALLHRLERVHQALVVSRIDLVKRESGRLPSVTENVSVRLFCGVMVIADSPLVNMRERSFNEAQQ